MGEKSKAFRVKDGNRSVRVSPHGKGWRFGYRDGERWRYVTRKKRSEIVEEAGRVLEDLAAGGDVVWSALTIEERERLAWVHRTLKRAEDWEALKGWVAARSSSEDVAAAVARFLATKEEEAGGKSRYLGQVRALLEQVAESFAGRVVADVTAAEVETWWRARCEGLGPKRRRDVRGWLVEFWNWCRRVGMVSDVVTAAEQLPSPKVPPGKKRVLSPAELAGVLNAVVPEFRAWVVLQAWAGMRPEEVAVCEGDRRPGRRGLHCEEIDWRFGYIRVPAEVAGKVDRPRVVPMSDALRAGLEWAGIREGMTGPVVVGDPVKSRETKRLGVEVFGDGWPQDALRHSFGSYRNALVRSLGQVAEEMGTSEAMLHRHYHNPRAGAEGVAWFSGVVLKSSDSGDAWVVVDGDEAIENPGETGDLQRNAIV